MRVTLDTDRNLILALPSDSESPDPLILSLGDPSIRVVICGSPILPLLVNGDEVAPGEMEFRAVPALGGNAVVTGSALIEEAINGLQTLTLSEDWAAAALVNLFPDASTPYVDLLAQWKYRSGASPALSWTSAPIVNLRVMNTLFRSEIIPGGVVLADMTYISRISGLFGGAPEDFDAIATTDLPLKTAVRIIVNHIESSWELCAGNTATDDPDQPSFIRPLDYNAGSNARYWTKVGGL